jgi:hypothetical protein
MVKKINVTETTYSRIDYVIQYKNSYMISKNKRIACTQQLVVDNRYTTS